MLPRLSLHCLLFAILLQLFWMTPTAFAKDRLAGPVPAVVQRVIDGDTLEVRARIWLDQEILVKVRLANIDTPELARPGCPSERVMAEGAKALVEQMVGAGAITLHDIHYGKYAGRVVARVETKEGGLAPALKAANFDGRSWC